MRTSIRRVRRAGLLVSAVAITATAAVAVAADDPNAARDYDLSGTPVQGVRPTAIGLPRIGESGTTGAGDMVAAVQGYHDSGLYEKDLATTAAAAQRYLDERLDARTAPGVKTCSNSYHRIPRPTGRRALYTRTRRCKTLKPDAPKGKPAIVLDIDETSLSNYSGMVATGFGFSGAGVAINSITGTGTAIKPVLALYKHARERGVDVFFVTGRPALINSSTIANLKAVGYDQGWARLDNKPSGVGTLAFKSGARAKIESDGYTIIANIGDQESDLGGGHAEKAFKLPNPFYFIPD
jgi:hypothetical protein